MIFGIALSDFLWLAVALLAAGAVTGILAGLFGVGGGAVIVPVLYQLFTILGVPEDLRIHLAVGSSLAIIIPTAIRSYQAHKARGAVDGAVLKVWAAPVVIGVLIGALIAHYAPGVVLKLVFVVVAGVNAVKLLFGRDSWKVADDLPGKAGMNIYGLVIGLLSSLMGIGGGQIANLIMTFHNRPIHQAVATSSGLGVLIAVPGTIGYMIAGWPEMARLPPLSLGYVSLLGAALFIPTSIWTAPIGVKLAHSFSKRKLEIAFGLFLAVVCIRFLVNILGY